MEHRREMAEAEIGRPLGVVQGPHVGAAARGAVNDTRAVTRGLTRRCSTSVFSPRDAGDLVVVARQNAHRLGPTRCGAGELHADSPQPSQAASREPVTSKYEPRSALAGNARDQVLVEGSTALQRKLTFALTNCSS